MRKKSFIWLLLTIMVLMSGCSFQMLPIRHAAVKTSEPIKKHNMDNLLAVNQRKMEQENQKREQLKNSIRQYLTSKKLSGSVSVVKDNQIVFREGIGYANKEKGLLNLPSTTYPIGSISKLFLATSIMKLQEEDKLNIQDPVSKYIPNFPNGSKIKLYHLMTHTSGISALHWHKGVITPLNLIQEIEKRPIKFQPGTQWDYLDANYMVLGYIVEKVTGTSLHNFIQENILDQVPMRETGFMTHDNPAPYNSVGYEIKGGKEIPTGNFNLYSLYACGDIYATPYDLSQFDNALLNGRLVSKSSLNQMLTPGSRAKYGLGLYYNGEAAYSLGVLGGYYTMHAYFNDHTSVVVFLNVRDQTTQIDNIVFQIHKIITDFDNKEEVKKISYLER